MTVMSPHSLQREREADCGKATSSGWNDTALSAKISEPLQRCCEVMELVASMVCTRVSFDCDTLLLGFLFLHAVELRLQLLIQSCIYTSPTSLLSGYWPAHVIRAVLYFLSLRSAYESCPSRPGSPLQRASTAESAPLSGV